MIHAPNNLTPAGTGSCNDCQFCLVSGELIVCGLLLADIADVTDEGDEIDTELAFGIHHTFAEECSGFLPNTPDPRAANHGHQ